ncbi:MAG: hypothetical protein K8J08_19850, partial [Thermoanaerobaculia bacterium]|nr:hypothetical protein [Thermoanaerobaculia bacterium]
MYQMVTGVLPFNLKNPLATAMLRLQQDPPPPSDHLFGLDAGWEQIILQCLRLEPTERPASVLEVLKAIDPARPHPAVESPAKRPVTRRWHVGLRLLAASVALAVLAWLAFHPGGTTDSRSLLTEASTDRGQPPLSKPRPALAITRLTALTTNPDVEWIGEAIAEMLSTEAAALPSLRIIPRQEVGRVENSVSSSDNETPLPGDPVEQLGSNLGARYIVGGTYLVEENDGAAPQLRVDLRLYDVLDGSRTASWSEVGAPERLIPLVRQLGASLRKG